MPPRSPRKNSKYEIKRRKPPNKRDSSHGSSYEQNSDLWIWGIHPILELLRLNPRKLLSISILTAKANEKIAEIEELADRHGIKTNRLDTLVNEEKGNHQGVEAKIKPVSFLSISELLAKSKNIKNPLFLALDSIQDPHNLGAIIRSASAAGVHGIIVTKDRFAPISGTVAKTAVGALAMVNLCQVTNLSNSLKILKKEGIWVFGAVGDAEQDIYGADFNEPTCLVIGSEGKGIRPLVKKQCDMLVSVPMHSSLDSLNASVAAGIILFEVVRQRE
jgi:23S rRNA (guanosine2251-2'-O)-methyltransferase